MASIRPRTRANTAFAAFAIGFGAQFVVTNVHYLLYGPDAEFGAAAQLVRLAFRVGAIAGLFALALSFPRPLRQEERRMLVLPAIAFLVIVSLARAPSSIEGSMGGIANFAFYVMFASLFFMLFVLAARHGRAAPDAKGERSQLVLMSAALLLYAGFASGSGPDTQRTSSLWSDDAGTVTFFAVLLLSLALLAVLWLRNAARSPEPRAARNVALLALAMPLLGLVYVSRGYTFGGLGVVRTLSVAVLAYAIVRHQLLGIDVKVRFTVRQSTLAAVFIGVFFVVSEAAQQFFGAFAGSTYLGIIAAGALVFALAPLQRFAERVADVAVPNVQAAVAVPMERRLEVYREALRYTLADRRVTPAEDLHLARLAQELGIGAADALEMRRHAEREVGPRRERR